VFKRADRDSLFFFFVFFFFPKEGERERERERVQLVRGKNVRLYTR